MTLLVGLLCATLGVVCAEPPSVGDVQTAYERAAQLPTAKHVSGLQIVGIDCDPTATGFSCQVGFRIAGESDERVYLDAVALKPDADAGWLLVSGLCLSGR
jgi:hypothetical protein